jgi:hypothetical protein
MTRNLVLLLATAAILWFAASRDTSGEAMHSHGIGFLSVFLILGAQVATAQPVPDGSAAWDKIAGVLTSPRCLNCHPRDDWPTQGETLKRHRVAAPQRGPHNHGVPAMRCSTCHQERNQEIAGIPGASHWHLAPASMGWVGLSTGALCRSIKDPAKNGNRTVAQVAAHMTEDALVRWAWTPGGKRQPPPVPFDEFAAALDAWMNAGAPCPQ